MGTAADIVRQACQVIWTDGDVSRVAEFYADDFVADYPMTDWGHGLAGVAALARQVRRRPAWLWRAYRRAHRGR